MIGLIHNNQTSPSKIAMAKKNQKYKIPQMYLIQYFLSQKRNSYKLEQLNKRYKLSKK